ncbi:MAG: hypothetical protein DI635_06795 [Pseudoxanthomonas suwonensis]|nr:MAG: hypothetical protein DI635_06795 [Pseudoxanthomonas suwonensis]
MKGQTSRSTSRTIRVAPVAQAVRLAIAASVTALALAGAGEAQAACVVTASGTVSCNGNFTNTVTYSSGDLTLVLGDTAPTTVNPPAGYVGVIGFGTYSARIISDADITTVDAPGIHALSYGTAAVANSGDINVTVNDLYADALGIIAYGAAGASIGNSGNVTVTGGIYGNAFGLWADGTGGTGPTVVDNSGAVTVSSLYGQSVGIVGLADAGALTITNAGTVSSSSSYANATGIYAIADEGLVTVTNAGSVSAVSGYANAIGVQLEGGAGGVNFTNSGAITATGVQLADGVFANSIGAASITNAAGGTITATADTWAAGIEAQSEDLTTVTNAGDIIGLSAGRGYGVYASGHAGVTIDNSGTIAAQGYYANGVLVQGTDVDSTITIRNSGNIIASDGTAVIATGVDVNSVYENTAVIIDNSGRIIADSGFGSTGINVVAGANGSTATITNSGAISVFGRYSTSGGYGAHVSVAGDATFTNTTSGDIDVYAGYGHGVSLNSAGGNTAATNAGAISVYGATYGVGIVSSAQNGTASAVNSGDITITGGWNQSYGMLLEGLNGATASNTGTILVNTPLADLSAGISATSGLGNVAVDNGGEIAAAGWLYGLGVYSRTTTGDVAISNSGDITADGRRRAGFGVFGRADQGNVTVSNSGSVTGTSNLVATAVGAAYGMSLVAVEGDVTADNSGSVYASSLGNVTVGILSRTPEGTSAITNSGTIDSFANSATANAFGVRLSAETGTVDNSGTITARSLDQGNAAGIYGIGTTLTATNSGSISAQSVQGNVLGTLLYGDSVLLSNTAGDITATTTGGQAVGAQLISTASSTFDSAAGSMVSATSQTGVAFGVYAISDVAAGTVTTTSAGDVLATSIDGTATGIFGSAFTVSVGTSGNVAAASTAAEAVGVDVTGHAAAVNAGGGSIAATSDAAQAIGIRGQGDGAAGNSVAVTNAAAVTATSNAADAFGISILNAEAAQASNSGSVTATAAAASASGISVTDAVTAQVANTGSITADAATYANGVLIVGATTTASLTNAGSINAVNATYAAGVYANIDGAFTVSNSGTISADGTYGVGLFAVTGGDASATSSGTVTVTGPDGAIGIGLASTANATLVHSGITTATSSAGDAVGIAANGDVASQVSNSGMVTATGATAAIAMGGTSNAGSVTLTNSGQVNAVNTAAGYAWGVYGSTVSGTVTVTNSGRVNASQADQAVGIHVSGPVTTVNNSGIVNPMAANDGRIAVLGEAGTDTINNTGHLLGALVTNAGDDVLNNGAGGVWHVFNTSTDFGDGNDSISNAAGGVISLSDGVIAMGAAAPSNAFTNAGVISVSGADTIIDMGTATSTLVNNGLIDFGGTRPIMPLGGSLHAASFGLFSALGDGVPDDVLTINGNLGGNGQLSIDVSLDGTTADELYVNGNMAAGAVQTVNINLDRAPTGTDAPIPFAFVTGTSTADSFVGGTVNGLGGSTEFLDLTVDVVSDIDASNARPDVFSIGVVVDGLNDVGSLSSLLPAAAQSLVASQVGTWRQRMGVVPQKAEDAIGLSPWFRYYYHTGDVNPGHVAANFNQGGNFAFEQTNRGWELGLNASIQQTGINVGILFGRGKASQHLTGDGIGTDHLDSNTVGLYATWLAKNGMYLDVSHRWTDFDADMFARDGLYATHGYANAFNAEFGYPFVLGSGFTIEPQAQYTRTKVEGIDPIRGVEGNFVNHDGESERGRLGVAFHQSFDSGNWVLTPYAAISAIREFEGKYTYSISDFHGGTDTSGTSAMAEFGFGARINAFSVTAGASWTDGGSIDNAIGGQVVLRYDW